MRWKGEGDSFLSFLQSVHQAGVSQTGGTSARIYRAMCFSEELVHYQDPSVSLLIFLYVCTRRLPDTSSVNRFSAE